MPSQKVYDRVTDWSGGMDAYKYAADLPRNQSQLLQNMVVLDNGRAVTRPGADKIGNQAFNPSGAVQGFGFLDNLTYGQLLLMGQGGKLYAWNGATWSASLAFALTSATASFSAVQGVDKLLISDGVQHMQLWDGNAFTDLGAAADTNAPIGATILSYIAGMFVVAGAAMVQGNGSTTYPADTLFFSNYLSAGVGDWNVNQSFRVGNGDGDPIVALAPIQSTASTTPVYQLAVLKANSVWVVTINPGGFQTQNQTVAWDELITTMFAAYYANPQGDQVGSGVGCVGKNAVCQYQNDLLFMSNDGVQSLQRMQAAAGQYQLALPLSRPIQPYIDRINWSMAYNIQAVKYRQYAIFFVPLDNSTTNNYALVWDGIIGQWMIWTGWTPEAVCVTRFNNGIALVVGNADGSVNQWKDAQTLFGLDGTYLDNGVPIPQTINTRSMVFGNLDFQKKPGAVLVRFNQGNAAVSLSAFCDLADSDNWNQNVAPGGVILPQTLPFVLASSKPVQCYRSLEGLDYFNEIYFSITAQSGWLDLRGIVSQAWMKFLVDPNG